MTGGTRGIGQAMAIALAEAGADIVLIQVRALALTLLLARRGLHYMWQGVTDRYHVERRIKHTNPR